MFPETERVVYTSIEEWEGHTIRIYLWRMWNVQYPWHAEVSVDGAPYVVISDECLCVSDAWDAVDEWTWKTLVDSEERND